MSVMQSGSTLSCTTLRVGQVQAHCKDMAHPAQSWKQGQDTPKQDLSQEPGKFGFDSEMGPPGFLAGPQSNGCGPEPSNNAAASEQHDDGMRPPGFPATPIEAWAP